MRKLRDIPVEEINIKIALEYPRPDGKIDRVDKTISGKELFLRFGNTPELLAGEFGSLYIKLCSEVTIHEEVDEHCEALPPTTTWEKEANHG